MREQVFLPLPGCHLDILEPNVCKAELWGSSKREGGLFSSPPGRAPCTDTRSSGWASPEVSVTLERPCLAATEATGPLACVQGGSFPSGSRPPTEPLLSAQISFVPAHTSGSFPLQSLLQPLPTCKAFSVLSSASPKGSLPSLSSIQAGGLYPTFFPRSQVRACLSFLVYNQELLAVGPTQSTFESSVYCLFEQGGGGGLA